MTSTRLPLLSTFCFASLLLVSSAASASVSPPDRPSKEYFISGQIMKGWVVSFGESGFDFLLDDGTNTLVENVPWSAVTPDVAKKIRSANGPKSGLEDNKKLAEADVGKVEATRFRLKTDRVITGKELPELSDENRIGIRTRTMSRFMIGREDIESQEKVMVPATLIYMFHELRAMKAAEINPQNGREYMELAVYLYRIGDYVGAKDAFIRAKLLDPRFDQPATQYLSKIEVSLAKQGADSLVVQIKTDIRGERYGEALLGIRRLRSISPDNPQLLVLESRIPDIQAEHARLMRRAVILAYYQKLDERVRSYAYGRVVDGVPIPGVRVTTTDSNTYAGVLKEDNDSFIELEMIGRRLRISKSAVVDVTPIELNKNTRQPTFTEAKQYVEDTSGGLAADVLADLEKLFKKDGLTLEQIKSYWDGRLTESVTVTDTRKTREVAMYLLRDVSYGKATWLRDDTSSNAGAGSRKIETDPERWWRAQPLELRHRTLRAMAAEAQCEVVGVHSKTCGQCGGKRYLVKVAANGSKAGSTLRELCPSCRGRGKFVVIRYR